MSPAAAAASAMRRQQVEMSEFTVRGQRVTVVGGAASGVAAARLLVERGASVTLTDLRPSLDAAAELAAIGVSLALGSHPEGLLTGSDLVVVSPGVPAGQPAVASARAAGVPVIGEVELASRWLLGRVVAITGTKGKSTTTALVGRMLEEAGVRVLVGGNIGTPLASQVSASTAGTVHVVEVSSFQLETTDTFHPWIAAMLNLSADHLDRHASVEEYAAAKARIFARQTGRDISVANADDARALAMAVAGRARVVRFARDARIDDGVTVAGGWIVERGPAGDTQLMKTSDVRLIGPHLLADVLASAAIARAAGAGPDAVARAAASFAGLEHAMELVDEIGGVRFVNDSKATNVDAARQAIETFGRGLVVIMGGRFKGGDLRLLRPALASRGATVVAIGEAAALMREAFDGAAPVRAAASMAEAVRAAMAAAAPGGSVLLAPACASFDMFDNYAARGRAFKAEVAALRREEG
ncbi:MAG: UDP-N-acetylmuramoyl-L-alanine--D-glutamate ligase [Vicinamibacterales bacterium]